MKLTNLVTVALLLSLVYVATPVQAKSIRLSREFWSNPPFNLVEAEPLDNFQNAGFYLDNMPPKMLSKRYSRIGGTIVMGR